MPPQIQVGGLILRYKLLKRPNPPTPPPPPPQRIRAQNLQSSQLHISLASAFIEIRASSARTLFIDSPGLKRGEFEAKRSPRTRS